MKRTKLVDFFLSLSRLPSLERTIRSWKTCLARWTNILWSLPPPLSFLLSKGMKKAHSFQLQLLYSFILFFFHTPRLYLYRGKCESPSRCDFSVYRIPRSEEKKRMLGIAFLPKNRTDEGVLSSERPPAIPSRPPALLCPLFPFHIWRNPWR